MRPAPAPVYRVRVRLAGQSRPVTLPARLDGSALRENVTDDALVTWNGAEWRWTGVDRSVTSFEVLGPAPVYPLEVPRPTHRLLTWSAPDATPDATELELVGLEYHGPRGVVLRRGVDGRDYWIAGRPPARWELRGIPRKPPGHGHSIRVGTWRGTLWLDEAEEAAFAKASANRGGLGAWLTVLLQRWPRPRGVSMPDHLRRIGRRSCGLPEE